MKQLKRNTKGIGDVLDWLIGEYAEGNIHNLIIGIEYKDGCINAAWGGSALILKKLGLARYLSAKIEQLAMEDDGD